MEESRSPLEAFHERIGPSPVVCVLGDDGEIVREERVRTTTAALTRALAGMTGARVVMEVGPRSPWLSRMLSTLGHDVIVANPRQVALIARSQRKTDRSDAEHLARLGRFDPKLLSPIRHRGARAQADLQTLRSRDALVRARTALINHVRGNGSMANTTSRGRHDDTTRIGTDNHHSRRREAP